MALTRFRTGMLGMAILVVLSFACPRDVFAWTLSPDFASMKSGTQGCGLAGSGGSTIVAASGSALSGLASSTSSNVCQMSVTGGSTAFGQWGGILTFPNKLSRGTEIWMRVRTYFPSGFNYNSTGEGGVLKFLRVKTESSAAVHEGYSNWLIMPEGSSPSYDWIMEGNSPQNIYFGSTSDAVQRGVWETWEMYLKLDNVPMSQGGTARARLYKNGKLLKDIQDQETLMTATSKATDFYLFTYWNGGAPKSQSMFIDSMTVTTDTPSNRDANNFPYLGMTKGTTTVIAPNPPTAVSVQ